MFAEVFQKKNGCFTNSNHDHLYITPLSREVRECTRLDPQIAIKRNSKSQRLRQRQRQRRQRQRQRQRRVISAKHSKCLCVLCLWLCVSLSLCMCPWPDSPLDKYGAILVASQTLAGRDAVVHTRFQFIASVDAFAGIHCEIKTANEREKGTELRYSTRTWIRWN